MSTISLAFFYILLSSFFVFVGYKLRKALYSSDEMYDQGYSDAIAWVKTNWKEKPIPGSVVSIDTAGDFIVIGYLDEGTDHEAVQYLPKEFLKGRQLSDLDDQEIDRALWTCPIEVFWIKNADYLGNL